MIGKLTGIIDAIYDDHAIIDVNGVGYVVFAAGRSLQGLMPGAAVSFIIETHVREDHIHLYGFATVQEREWFRLLTSVQRVGAKMALSLLHSFDPGALERIMLAKDIRALSSVSGVGAKLAERIIAELKDKALKPATTEIPAALTLASGKRKSSVSPVTTAVAPSALEDAISALVNLGYGRSEAFAAVQRASERMEAPSSNVQDMIRSSLKELVSA